MADNQDCDGCEYELVTPKAQFMFSSVEKCRNCGDVKRPDHAVEHLGLPRQVRELLEE